MPIIARCPNTDCGKGLKVKDELAGKKVKCPACATVFVVPAAEPESPPPPKKPVPPPPAKKKAAVVFDDEEDEDEAPPAPKKPAAGPPAKKKALPAVEDEEEEEEEAPRQASKKPAAAPPPKKKAAPVDEDEDSQEDKEEETGEDVEQETASKPAAAVAGTGLDKNTQMIMFGGLGALALLAVSVFLPWFVGISGIQLVPGIANLILSVAAAGAITALFVLKKPVAPALLGGGAAGTCALGYCLITFIRGFASYVGIGFWLSLLGALGAIGTFVWCSIRSPYRLPALNKEGTSPFLKNYATLLGALAIGLVLGIALSFTGAVSSVR